MRPIDADALIKGFVQNFGETEKIDVREVIERIDFLAPTIDGILPDGALLIERDGNWTKASMRHNGETKAVKVPTHCKAWTTYTDSIEAAARAFVSELYNDDEDNWRYSLACAGE